MELAVWLRSLGLEQYEAAFRENAIDFSVLPDVTDQDLEKLGVLGLDSVMGEHPRVKLERMLAEHLRGDAFARTVDHLEQGWAGGTESELALFGARFR